MLVKFYFTTCFQKPKNTNNKGENSINLYLCIYIYAYIYIYTRTYIQVFVCCFAFEICLKNKGTKNFLLLFFLKFLVTTFKNKIQNKVTKQTSKNNFYFFV
ncbi:hypothetical protein PanWU01x14_021060 [Parasponia andersonii]|uniref:Transmembrane protein n=1 Tax=Parasponia andersonii TaxID=3476 RepID=A0A2P5DXV9_PARAD|nr:hypothetical protein PanWU01x14_021060 [Parasponia andersonii]